MSDVPVIPSLESDDVERALGRLSFLEREALLMKARDKMTYTEIGAVLGLSAPQVEAKVAAALVKLHARLVRCRRRPRLGLRWRLPRRFRMPFRRWPCRSD